MERFSIFYLEQQAISLGATYMRHKFIDVSYYVSTSRVEIWSTHFFNSEHKEVAMFIDSADLYQLTGLTIFKEPRIWADCYINHKNMGKPIDFETRGVKHF